MISEAHSAYAQKHHGLISTLQQKQIWEVGGVIMIPHRITFFCERKISYQGNKVYLQRKANNSHLVANTCKLVSKRLSVHAQRHCILESSQHSGLPTKARGGLLYQRPPQVPSQTKHPQCIFSSSFPLHGVPQSCPGSQVLTAYLEYPVEMSRRATPPVEGGNFPTSVVCIALLCTLHDTNQLA